MIAVCLAVLLGAGLPPNFPLQSSGRVLFLGDSITQNGGFVEYLDAFLSTRYPSARFDLVKLGLSSETVNGLSEPDHPFPRPRLQTRLDRALAQTRPRVVVAMYGMNDGIYYPFSEERLAAFQAGIWELIGKTRAIGARLILLTPTPFDAPAKRNQLLEADAPRFSWKAPYRDYDGVLERYGQWLLGLREKDVDVIDARAALVRYAAERRRSEPDFLLSPDGIHPSPVGHWLITETMLKHWNVPSSCGLLDVDLRGTRVPPEVRVRSGNDSATIEWVSPIPAPLDPRWAHEPGLAGRIAQGLSSYRLSVTGLRHQRYLLLEGETRLAELSRTEIERGLDLMRFRKLSTNVRAAEVLRLVQQRWSILGPAWLSHAGHRQPGSLPAKSLQEALRESAVLQEKARELSQPVRITLCLVPLDEK